MLAASALNSSQGSGPCGMTCPEQPPLLRHRMVPVLSDEHYDSSGLLPGSAGAVFRARVSAEGGQDILTFMTDRRGHQRVLLQPASD